MKRYIRENHSSPVAPLETHLSLTPNNIRGDDDRSRGNDCLGSDREKPRRNDDITWQLAFNAAGMTGLNGELCAVICDLININNAGKIARVCKNIATSRLEAKGGMENIIRLVAVMCAATKLLLARACITQ